MGDKWTLLIVRDLAAGPRRFVELQRVLPGISTEQLRSRLNRMVADGLLTRQRYREVPPRVDYELTDRARDLLPVVGALSRWGYRWAWSAPRPERGHRHRRDPALGPRPRAADAHRRQVELEVRRRNGELKRYVLHAGDGRVELEERSAPDADARISGTEQAWIAAFGPDAVAAPCSRSRATARLADGAARRRLGRVRPGRRGRLDPVNPGGRLRASSGRVPAAVSAGAVPPAVSRCRADRLRRPLALRTGEPSGGGDPCCGD